MESREGAEGDDNRRKTREKEGKRNCCKQIGKNAAGEKEIGRS